MISYNESQKTNLNFWTTGSGCAHERNLEDLWWRLAFLPLISPKISPNPLKFKKIYKVNYFRGAKLQIFLPNILLLAFHSTYTNGWLSTEIKFHYLL